MTEIHGFGEFLGGVYWDDGKGGREAGWQACYQRCGAIWWHDVGLPFGYFWQEKDVLDYARARIAEAIERKEVK
jgi:hypothetical protein